MRLMGPRAVALRLLVDRPGDSLLEVIARLHPMSGDQMVVRRAQNVVALADHLHRTVLTGNPGTVEDGPGHGVSFLVCGRIVAPAPVPVNAPEGKAG